MPHLWPIVASYGYAAVFVLLLVESLGVPAPGEGVLIVTALFAARTHRLDIAVVIVIAATGAFTGSSLGYFVGRAAGRPLLLRYGRYVGLNAARQRLGQYLFLRHGAKIVFLGRFIAFLRAFAGLLAGLNHMPLGRFLAFNALGAATWTTAIGLGAYTFGHVFVHVSRPVGTVLVVLGLLALVAGLVYVRRREADLQKLADAALVATP
jgi:membrane protein DedA with SNARE-associated domain